MSWPVGSAYGVPPVQPTSTVAGAPEGMQQKPRSSLATLAEKLSGTAKASRIETVKVDGLVLMKIIKHCTESLPELVSGSLLGMDVDADLEVTNSFPMPIDPAPEEGAEAPPTVGGMSAEGVAFKNDMLKLLRDINVDCNPVGWYRSSYLGSFCTASVVQQMFQYQDALDHDQVQKSVVLVYDPFMTKRGNLSLKAYRLTDSFMKMYRERKVQISSSSVVKLSPAVVAALGSLPSDGTAQVATAETELSAEEIFDELPIEITNAHLFTVLIDDLKQRNGDRLDVDFDRLNLSTNAFLSHNLEFIVEEADNLGGEQSRKNQEKRRVAKAEQDQIKFIMQRRMENQAREERGDALLPEVDASNPIFKTPAGSSSLESLLIRKQIGIYTQQINRYSGQGFSKLYLAGAMQGKKVA